MKKIIDVVGVVVLGLVFGFLISWGMLGSPLYLFK